MASCVIQQHMSQKRRITPQQIIVGQAAAPQQDPSVFQTALATVQAPQQKKLSLKEQSEYAAKHLGPGRRIYVELGPDNYEVNWQKVPARQALLLNFHVYALPRHTVLLFDGLWHACMHAAPQEGGSGQSSCSAET